MTPDQAREVVAELGGVAKELHTIYGAPVVVVLLMSTTGETDGSVLSGNVGTKDVHDLARALRFAAESMEEANALAIHERETH